MDQTIQKALSIFDGTDDGERLRTDDLALLWRVTTRGEDASESDRARLDRLHRQVAARCYVGVIRDLYEIEHLSKDDEARVYWKGEFVDFMGVSEPNAVMQWARELAAKCRGLEAKGYPIDASTIRSRWCQTAPPRTPWKPLLLRLEEVYFRGGNLNCLRLRVRDGRKALVWWQGDSLRTRVFGETDQHTPGALAVRAAMEMGLVRDNKRLASYHELVQALESEGWKPGDFAGVLS